MFRVHAFYLLNKHLNSDDHLAMIITLNHAFYFNAIRLNKLINNESIKYLYKFSHQAIDTHLYLRFHSNQIAQYTLTHQKTLIPLVLISSHLDTHPHKSHHLASFLSQFHFVYRQPNAFSLFKIYPIRNLP